MKLFNKLDRGIIYSNSYGIRRSIAILEGEFEFAKKTHDTRYANEVIDTSNKIYKKLSEVHKNSDIAMNYTQKLWANRLKQFVKYLNKNLEENFGTQNHSTIETTK